MYQKNKTKQILIVDDDRESNDNLRQLLSAKFDTIHSAYDGVEGWNLFRTHHPDVLICDIQMPHLDGLELIQKIRSVDSRCFIAVLTSYSDHHYLMRAVSLKLDGYIIKPLTSTKLTALIETIQSSTRTLHPQTITIDAVNTYNMMAKTIIREGDRIALTHREITLLELLLEHRGNVLSYEMIEYALYETEMISRNAIKILISHLRKKIGLNITAIPKIGYLLP